MLSSFSPFKYKHHILFTFRKTLISLSICERASAKGICTFVTVLHICLKTLQQFHIPKSRPHLKSKATFYCLLLSKSTFNQEIWQLFPDSWWKSTASQITTFHAYDFTTPRINFILSLSRFIWMTWAFATRTKAILISRDKCDYAYILQKSIHTNQCPHQKKTKIHSLIASSVSRKSTIN